MLGTGNQVEEGAGTCRCDQVCSMTPTSFSQSLRKCLPHRITQALLGLAGVRQSTRTGSVPDLQIVSMGYPCKYLPKLNAAKIAADRALYTTGDVYVLLLHHT